MKLTIVTKFFPPETGAAAARLFELGKRLAAAGHQVQVLCPFPKSPSGAALDGYRGRVHAVETIDGIRVVRARFYGRRGGGRTGLIGWLERAPVTLCGVLLGSLWLGRQDVVLVNSPPLEWVPLGLWTGRVTRARTVMYVADMNPDAMIRLGLNLHRNDLRGARRRERMGYERSDLVLTTTPSTMKEIRARFPHVPVAVLPNGADTDLFRPSRRSPAARTASGAGADDFLVGYFGLHGSEQGLEAVVDAAARVEGSGIRFVMAGGGKAKAALEGRARQLGIGNIRFLDVLPRPEVAVALASCDAALIPLKIEMPGTMPSKVFETLASGVPLVVTDGCDAAELVRANKVGRVFRPRDGAGLARVLTDLAANPQEREDIRRNCLDLARQHDRDKVAARAEEILLDLLERPVTGGRLRARTAALLRRIRRRGRADSGTVARPGSAYARRLPPDPGIDAVVDAGVDWLRWGQELSASGDGGVAAHFDIAARRWSSSYPETTGYIVPTLLDHAGRRDDEDARHRARRMLDWLVSVQFAEGGLPGGLVTDDPQVPVVFNTGQVLLGLAAGERAFGGYRAPLRRAATWLADAQDADGCWRRHHSPFAMPGEKTYDVHAAWGLLEADRIDPGRGHADAALRNIRWALTRQRSDGFMDQCCLEDPDRPLTHTLGYALRGIIEGYRAGGGDDLLAAARLTADGLLRCIGADGFLPGRIAPGWRPAADWACLTGTVQVAACWFLLHRITRQRRYLVAGRSANAFVRRTVRLAGPPGLRGGVTGSWPVDGPYQRNRCISWAAKFCIDSNLLEKDLNGT